MKTNFLKAVIVAAMVASAASCERETSNFSSECVKLSLSFSDGASCATAVTKAAGDASSRVSAEKNINNVQIFVFNRDGSIDNCKRYTGGGSTDSWTMPEPMECTTGTKDVWAVVNAKTDYTSGGAVMDKASLLRQTVLLEDIDIDGNVSNLIMVGNSGEKEFSATGGTPLSFTIDVHRLVCAVTLEKVQNLIQNANYSDKVLVCGAFLMQAPGIQRIDGGIAASNTSYDYTCWYARHSKETGCNILTDSFAETPVAYGEGNAYTSRHTFYCFANDYGFGYGGDSSDAVLNDGTDKKSSTYLVVEAKINGSLYYYPVVLPKLEPNVKYGVSLTIEHLGSRNPWEKVTFTDFKPAIRIEDWSERSYTDII